MVGRAVSLELSGRTRKIRSGACWWKNLSCVNGEGLRTLSGVSFEAKGGEILGIAGIAGSGQKELCEAIAGLQPGHRRPHLLLSPRRRSRKSGGQNAAFHPEAGREPRVRAGGPLGMGLVGDMGMVDT
jgi:simple sugar transport system ATP-binding protein